MGGGGGGEASFCLGGRTSGASIGAVSIAGRDRGPGEVNGSLKFWEEFCFDGLGGSDAGPALRERHVARPLRRRSGA